MFHYKQSIIAIISVLFFFLLTAAADAQTPEALIQEGDKYTDEYNNEKALDSYLKADKLSHDNWKILWRISRSYVNIAVHMPSADGDQEDAQLAVLEKALGYADRAVKLAKDQSVVYVRRAVVNGRIALFKGVFTVGGVVNQVKDDCEKAIRLGNGDAYTLALAHYILGRTHAKVSEKWAPARAVLGLGWADKDTALVELKRAVDLYPNFRMFYLELGKAYLSNDEYDKAKYYLNKVVDTPKKDQDDDQVLAEAKQLLKDLND
ncbi:MAG TPA: tetratricopeptide repeat protein [Ignavibacteriaceae bacterium]